MICQSHPKVFFSDIVIHIRCQSHLVPAGQSVKPVILIQLPDPGNGKGRGVTCLGMAGDEGKDTPNEAGCHDGKEGCNSQPVICGDILSQDAIFHCIGHSSYLHHIKGGHAGWRRGHKFALYSYYTKYHHSLVWCTQAIRRAFVLPCGSVLHILARLE